MLRDYQIEAVNKVENAVKSGQKKIKIEMAVGTGRFYVLAAILRLDILNGMKALIITATKLECDQMERRIGKENLNIQYDICTYASVEGKIGASESYDLIIFNGIYYGEVQLNMISDKYPDVLYIGFTSVIEIGRRGMFEGIESTYSYSYTQALQDGYINRFNSEDRIIQFCIDILYQNGYSKIKPVNDNRLGDVEAELNGKKSLFEIRYYREKYVEKELIYKCVENLHSKRLANSINGIHFFLVMFCLVDESVKQRVKKELDITIWDISNIIYLCSNNSSLFDALGEITRYSITGIEESKVEEEINSEHPIQINDSLTIDRIKQFEKALKECPEGDENGADKQYEKLCFDIIKELFEPALGNFSAQRETKNRLFRMDLISTIKSEEGLWKFLKYFYRTNYIVFEFKNYSKNVSQNTIFITEKYLSAPALRNVAIIVSRHGFDKNASKVAISELHSRGYLIIDVTDEDLMVMLSKKQSGEKPEEIIQAKIDNLLMEIDI